MKNNIDAGVQRLSSKAKFSSRLFRSGPATLVCLGALAFAALPARVCADELTGLSPQDDKEVIPVTTGGDSCRPTGFLPLPRWSHLVSMPALPDTLQPMGRSAHPKVVEAQKPSLAPPKDAAVVAVKPVPAAPPSSTALVAVSPFLQWVKANPQVAAAEARQQANSYQPPQGAGSNSANPGVPGNAGSSDYWLPPLIDSAPVTSVTPGGSAAIYSTPQR